MEFLAQILTLYPDREIYFLARDAELLYDLAILVSQSEPDLARRLHLLNISRANMRAPQLVDYLAQEGISEARLRAGTKVLFVDTGYEGTIPQAIAENFSPKVRNAFATHLIVSRNVRHPSSRAFLTALNPAAAIVPPSTMNSSLVQYENSAHTTWPSSYFANREGRWVPMSPTHGSMTDGAISKETAQMFMEDLADFWNLESTPSSCKNAGEAILNCWPWRDAAIWGD